MIRQTLAEAFALARADGRAAFIPYLTAGDPDLAATRRFVRALVDAGAAIVELGVPFSDPLADGPVNARAAGRALARGTKLADVLGLVRTLRADGVRAPIVLFTYFNPVHAMGIQTFAASAAAAGANGALVVDLPPEEAGDYRSAMRAHGLDTVFLTSPTTPPERLSLIGDASTGFVYHVSRNGVTGARAELSPTLEAELRRARTAIRAPLAVGFGVSDPAQARFIARHADGVVVGSALVALVESSPDLDTAVARLTHFAKSIVDAARTPKETTPC